MGQLVRSKRAGQVMMQRVGGSKLRDRQLVWFIMLTPTLKTLTHF